MILYEQRSPRIVHLIALLGTLILVGALVGFVFLPGSDPGPGGAPVEIGNTGRIVFGFLTLAGIFLSGVFGYRLIKNPVTFRMTEEGFEYNPSGVSTGLIRWTDIEEIKYVPVLTNRSGIGGPARLFPVGIILKDPQSYIARHPAAMGVLFEYRKFESGTPLVFTFGEFGRNHERVVAMMQEQVRLANSRR